MKRIAVLATVLAFGSVAVAQSVSIGYERKGSFAAVETPAWQTEVFRSADWHLSLDPFMASRVDGPKGLGIEFAIEKRFYTVRLLGIPLASAYWHLGVGTVDFVGEKPHGTIIFGLTVR